MQVVGQYKDLLDYYNEHYDELSEDNVVDMNQSYDKYLHTRYTWLIANKDNHRIELSHEKCSDWNNEGEWFIVKVDDKITNKEAVNNFFNYEQPTNIDGLKKLLNIK